MKTVDSFWIAAARKLRPISVGALLLAGGIFSAQLYPRPARAERMEAMQGDVAVAQREQRGLYDSLAEAMGSARNDCPAIKKDCAGVRGYKLTVRKANCSYSISPVYHAFTSSGGKGAVNVSTEDGCVWTSAPDVPWITITSGASGSGKGLVNFTVAPNSNGVSRLGSMTVAGRKAKIAQAPPLACVSAASYAGNILATESIVAAFGVGLARTTEVATTLPLPTTLAGTRVSVLDGLGVERFAELFFVSPGQINFQIPHGIAAGRAMVTIINDGEMVAAGVTQIEMVAPGLFSADASGQGVSVGVALRVRADGSSLYEPIAHYDPENQQFVAAPIDLGAATDRVFLVLFATGARYRSSLGAVSVKIGGVNTDALYTGPQGTFAGLDQLNVLLPRSLYGRGEVEVSVSLYGAESNRLKVAIR